MRLLVLLALALSLSASAYAQDNTTADNATLGEPAANETTQDANATSEPETPAAPEPIEIVLEGVQEGSAAYFRGADGKKNPALTVLPGQQVTFRFKSIVGVHNLNIAGKDKTALLSDGEEATLVWTAPAEGGRVEYWCDPHKAIGMKGVIQVGAAPAPSGGGEEGEISGETIDLGEYDPACVGKKAPAAAAEGMVGLPTLQDYIDQCKSVGGVTTQARAKHAADYVIPLSWLLVAVGIGGVVWVHKYYKP